MLKLLGELSGSTDTRIVIMRLFTTFVKTGMTHEGRDAWLTSVRAAVLVASICRGTVLAK